MCSSVWYAASADTDDESSAVSSYQDEDIAAEVGNNAQDVMSSYH